MTRFERFTHLFPGKAAALAILFPSIACGQPGVAAVAPQCSMQEISRLLLKDRGGNPLYIEPVALSRHPDNGTVLLAGSPNYSYSTDSNGQMTGMEKNSVFGVVLRDTVASAVANPIDAQIMSVRAAPVARGGWNVVFAEFPRSYTFPDAERVVALWHGVIVGNSVSKLVKIPIAGGLPLHSFNSSQLVAVADTLWWVMRYQSDDSSGVAIFKGVSDGGATSWSNSYSRIDDLSYAALGLVGDARVALFAARGSEGILANSLHVYANFPNLSSNQLLVSGRHGSVQSLQFAGSNAAAMPAWISHEQQSDSISNRVLRFLGGPLQAQSETAAVTDNVVNFVAIQSSDSVARFVASHAAEGSGKLSYWSYGSRGAIVSGEMVNPYTGPFSAIEKARDTLLFAGPLLRTDGVVPPLTSLLLTVASRCTAPR